MPGTDPWYLASEAKPSARSEATSPDLLSLLARARRRWQWIAVSAGVSVALASLYLVTSTRRYPATAQLFIFQQEGRPLNVATNDPGSLVREKSNQDIIPTHMEIVSSPMVVERAIKLVGLGKLPTLKDKEAPVLDAIKGLKVSRPDHLADVIELEYRAKSPEEAVQFLDALTTSYESSLAEIYRKSNNRAVALIMRAKSELMAELDQLNDKYLAFRRQHPIFSDEKGQKVESLAMRRLEHWDRAANETRLKQIQLKTQLDVGRRLAQNKAELWEVIYALSQIGGMGGEKVDNGSGSMVAETWETAKGRQYVALLEQEQQQLAERYGAQASKVREIEEHITRIQQRGRGAQHGQADLQGLLKGIELSLKGIEASETEIEGRFNQDLHEANRDETILLTEANLRDERERRRSLYNAVVDQLKQAQLSSDFSGGIKCQVIQPATFLAQKVRMKMMLVLGLALVGGCMVGAAAGMVVDYHDKRYHSVEELHRSLGLPVLGSIPEFSRKQVAASGSVGLMSHALPHAPLTEGFRLVRTTIQFLSRNRRLQVILVTSPQPGDGRSTVASNLAISLAHAGRKVLLVDADLRHPTQAKIHNGSGDRGLLQVLRDRLPIDHVVQHLAVENLDLIASGPVTPDPAGLFTSASLTEFLGQARNHYDSVIIDAPSLLAGLDSAAIGAEVDGILLVVRLSSTGRPEAEQAVALLGGLDTPTLGILVNRIDRDQGRFGSGISSYARSGSQGSAPLSQARPSNSAPGDGSSHYSLPTMVVTVMAGPANLSRDKGNGKK